MRGELHPAGAVVAAAGPWTPEAIGGGASWVRPNWGVVAQVRLRNPPRHGIEQAGVEALTEPGGGAPPKLFSIVTTGEVSAVGSTFTDDEPDAAAVAPTLVERGARFIPELEHAAIEHVRACARPLAADGRPLLGAIGEGLYLVTGHGAWGITLGPGLGAARGEGDDWKAAGSRRSFRRRASARREDYSSSLSSARLIAMTSRSAPVP